MRKHLKQQISFLHWLLQYFAKVVQLIPTDKLQRGGKNEDLSCGGWVRWREDGRFRRIDLALHLRSIIDGIDAPVACHTFSLAASAAEQDADVVRCVRRGGYNVVYRSRSLSRTSCGGALRGLVGCCLRPSHTLWMFSLVVNIHGMIGRRDSRCSCCSN